MFVFICVFFMGSVFLQLILCCLRIHNVTHFFIRIAMCAAVSYTHLDVYKRQQLTQPIINPLTGELMAEAGEVVSFEKAQEIDNAGVSVAFVLVNEKETKVISNAVSYTHLAREC